MIRSPLVRSLIELSVEEDLGKGDITSEILISETSRSEAIIIAREEFVFCGGFIVQEVLSHIDAGVAFKIRKDDGDLASNEEVLVELSGSTRSILSAERTILNFLQRLSGIATLTRTYTKAADGLRILDTRKTTPGWRHLEKYAVSIGGGSNHRADLGEMMLVKNNHIDANGGDFEKIGRLISEKKPKGMRCEIEVRNRTELTAALKLNPDVVMLDNMDDKEIRESVSFIRECSPKTEIELSGGMTIDRIEKLRDLAPLSVSVGALTTKAINVDISLRVKKTFDPVQ